MSDLNPWAQIVGRCYRRASLARALGWTEDEVTAAAGSLQILELLTDDDVLLYPEFQMNEGQPVEGLARVLEVLSTGTRSRWTWAQWLNSPFEDDSREPAPRAIERLRAGQFDEVFRDAGHAAAAWRS